MNVAEMYDEVSGRYEELISDSKYIGPHWIEQKLQSNIHAYREFLDLGCATGPIGAVISNVVPEARIVGLDISSEMVELASKRGVYEQLYVHNLDEPIQPLITNKYDAVTALGFSEFLSKPEQMLKEINLVLKEGGRCFMSFQLHDPSNEKLPRNTYSGSVVHTAYTESEVQNMVQNSGLKLVSLESLCGYVSGRGYECHYIMIEARKI
ncbi:methyltransferase [Veronia nyctiphanis]|uniref:Methyltransferase n=1 Tax=Veronia nyctiphanis TaxID=1278244 RepID=A0A4Q0YSC4_9GAMM|nr:class I SAM-dependent methyltransferase [Veronia nyctiphanis]RXJ71861.1 methyltransferase [Veronia nyctiphanis]